MLLVSSKKIWVMSFIDSSVWASEECLCLWLKVWTRWFSCPPEAVSWCHAVQRHVRWSWSREPAVLPAPRGGGGGDLWQHGGHQRPTSPLRTQRPCLHSPWLQPGNTHSLKKPKYRLWWCRSLTDVVWTLSWSLCVWAEADGVPGPDSEGLLRDPSEHLRGAPPSGSHRPLLTADGEEMVKSNRAHGVIVRAGAEVLIVLPEQIQGLW